jgi:hypothetical protein
MSSRELSQTAGDGDGSPPVPPADRPAARFGDIIENGWASLTNPTRQGFFVREFHRSGKMNPGRTWEVTDGNGLFWELKPTGDHKITVKPALSGGMGRAPCPSQTADDVPGTN